MLQTLGWTMQKPLTELSKSTYVSCRPVKLVLRHVAVQDHISTQKYPEVMGMQQPLFFWNHNYMESGSDSETRSKYNCEEAVMAAKLAKYLVQQGYRCVLCTPIQDHPSDCASVLFSSFCSIWCCLLCTREVILVHLRHALISQPCTC